jgi:HK97 gp10 family phage protein
MTDTVNVKGLSDLAAFLDQLPTKVQNNVMRGALRAGMAPVRDDAKAYAAVATGLLRDGLKVSTRNKGGVVTASLKATGKHARVAHLVEFGTAAHRIAAKDGGALSFGGGFVQHVDHPGARARPFLRPALDGQAQNAIIAAAEYMKERLSTKEGLDTSAVLIEGDA